MVKLCSPEAVNCPFQYGIGDKVRSKISNFVGRIVAGECACSGDGPYKITYQVERSDRVPWLSDESDIELLPQPSGD